MRTKRDTIIRIRVTQGGKERWQAVASQAGMPLSEWLRAAARAAARGTLDDRSLREEVVRLRTELNRAGSNLNQALALAHAGHLDRERIEQAIADIAALRQAVESALRT